MSECVFVRESASQFARECVSVSVSVCVCLCTCN